jgi:hypothetical protein
MTLSFNGKNYPVADFLERGYFTSVISGTGDSLPRWQAALVDAIADSGRQMRGSSVTVNTIGTGAKTFVLDNDLPFGANENVQVFNTADRTKNMFGSVTSYTQSTKTLVLNITETNGSGSGITTWAINACGPKGATGAAGAVIPIVGDTAPQLGGDLDVNGHVIKSVSNGNIPITPHGTGVIQLGGTTTYNGDELTKKMALGMHVFRNLFI